MANASEVDDGPDLVALQGYWKKVIEKREPKYREYWERARQVCQRFEDRRNTQADAFRYKGGRSSGRRYNILWSNTETMSPLLFNKVPSPVVRRRWGDDDPVARTAAEMLERCTTANIERSDVYFVDHMKATVQNMLVSGTGQLWIRYDPDVRTMDGPSGPMMMVADQVVHADYVHWRDFMAGEANVWSQVPWVSRDLWMTPREVAQRWGTAVATMCNPKRRDDENHDGQKKCCIKEIWDKESKTVLFFSKDMPRIIEAKPDPLGLKNFFPCSKPLFGFWATQDIIPSPIFCQYQDQAAELDECTTQIYNMLNACKVSGVYNSEMGSDFQKMLEGHENKIIPITDWPSFMTGGSMQGNVAFFPLAEVVQALTALYQAREAVKADLNEITGMPDIFRGQSSPLDAEGTNDLKVQWGASRMRDDQREVQRFVADVVCMQAEVIAEQFTPQNLLRMSGMRLMTMQEKAQAEQSIQMMQAQAEMQGQKAPDIPPEMEDKLQEPTIEEVVQLLRSDVLRYFVLDVETDSTVESDDTKERQGRAEFIDVLTGMIERWGPIVQQVPQMLPMVKELVLFAIAPFRAGRQLEEEVERTFTALELEAKAASEQPPQPDPIDKATEAEMQKTAMQEQGDTQREAMQQAGEDRRQMMKIAADKEARELDTVVDLAKEAMKP